MSFFPHRLFAPSRAAGLALLSAALLLPLAAAAATSPENRGVITGRVANATGDYLENAEITVANTALQAFTDAAGSYRITDVPSGPVVLRIFYTGLGTREVTLDMPPGGTLRQDVELAARGADAGITRLDPYTISASREMSVSALAVNEQRFAANIKNVVAADAFGDISQGNVGEFIKYLPAITADFADPNIISVSVRGLPSNLTSVTSDGAQMASAHTGGSTRVFQFDQVSINNLSRVELTKVPTPADPADSLGGVLNLVSKSAFEHKVAQFNYRLYLNGRQRNLTLSKLPDTRDDTRYRVLPNADFTYTVPVNDKFGLVVSGISANSFDERHVAARVYNTSLAGSGASVDRPFMQSYILQDAPRFIYRDSISLKAEWRISPNATLSVSGEHSDFLEYFGMNQMTVNAGANATPVAGGQAFSFGPDFTRGAGGRGAVTLDGQFFDIRGATNLGNVRYRLDNGTWQIRAGTSFSKSTTRFDDLDDGHFYTLTAQLSSAAGFVGSPFTINLLDIGHEGPRTIDIRDSQNRPVDLSDPKNYQLSSGTSLPRDVIDQLQTLDLGVRRRINQLSFPLALEVGGARRVQKHDTQLGNSVWTYNGPDGSAATIDNGRPYLTPKIYEQQPAGFGFFNIPWLSPTKAYAAWQADPRLFTQTLAQAVAAETFRIGRSEAITETVTAGYVEAEGRFFRNRLRALAGVRYERTVDAGDGALTEPTGVYQRDASGAFVHDSRGNLVRKPEAGAVGSLEQVRVTLFERGAHAKRSYDGYYPSLHLTYNVTSNLQARFAYARTYGRPNFSQIIPNATINDFDAANATGALGTINLRNPGLRPWTADNYDLSIEHYTDTGGIYSIGVYRKELDGFFQQRVKLATVEDLAALDLDPRYVGYEITTTYNLGRGHVSGVEGNARQSLERLGTWGRRFEVFGNVSLFKDTNSQDGRTINAGVTFRLKPVTFDTKVNYRSEKRNAAVAALGPDAYEYEGARTTVDLTLTYAISKRLSLFASSSNALDDRPSADRRGSQTPEYAQRFREQQYGALYSLGLRGTF